MSWAMATRLSGPATASMTSDIFGRVAAFDWTAMAAALDAHGAATADLLLGPEECDALAACYNDDIRFSLPVLPPGGKGNAPTSACALYWICFTSGQPPSSRGRNAWSAGTAATSLK